MFGKGPKPGSPKAKQKYLDLESERIRNAKDYESNSQHLADSQWESYAADHPGAKQQTSRRGIGGTSYTNHPEYAKMLQAHYNRVDEYNSAAKDTMNSAYQRLVDPTAHLGEGLFNPSEKNKALQQTHHQVLNSQQFGQLPEYGN